MLLHSWPDTVHRVLLRKTQTSTPLIEGSSTRRSPQIGITPAVADCRYRAPLSPRLRKIKYTWFPEICQWKRKSRSTDRYILLLWSCFYEISKKVFYPHLSDLQMCFRKLIHILYAWSSLFSFFVDIFLNFIFPSTTSFGIIHSVVRYALRICWWYIFSC